MSTTCTTPTGGWARRALALVLAAAMVLQAPALAMAQAEPRSPAVNMDFDGVDIKVFIKFISELTGKNFILDEKLRGKVTVLSPTAISVDEAYKVFESVLSVYGYTPVQVGRIVKIIPSREGKKRGLETIVGDALAESPGDRMVTQIVSLSYLRSSDVRKMVAPLISADGLITEYAPTGTLIIIDHESNVQRLLRIIGAIDQKGMDLVLTVIQLEHASAKSMASQLTNLAKDIPATISASDFTPDKPQPVQQPAGQEGGAAPGQQVDREAESFTVGGGSTPAKIVADERTNSLIVLAGPRETLQIKDLVDQLDRPASADKSNIKVYFLEHADAEELSGVFGQLAGAAGGKTEEGKAQAPVISKGATIVADKATNSLVVTAPPEDFEVLERIIAELDIPRRQVFVEALIMEISSDTSISYGVSWNTAGLVDNLGQEGGVLFGASNPGGFNSIFSGDSLIPPAGLAVGAASFPVTIAGVTYTNLQALIEAAQSENEFNIISTPQLMTLDNEEATIIVADNRPFLTSQFTGQNVDDLTNQQFEYRDVGTTLKITPQISEGGTIKMKIYQEQSRVDEAVTQETGALQPTTRKRTTETTVVVNDGQTIIISGLIGANDAESNSKVPLLGDIPGLGWLFRSTRKSTDKTNLLVFMTPRIVANPSMVEDVSYTKMRELDDLIYDEHERIKPLLREPRPMPPLG